MLKTKPGSLHRRRLSTLADFGDLDLRDLSDDKVRFAYRTQCFYSALDTLGLCQFVWGPSWQLYGPTETVELVRSGTGWDADLEELLQAGERRLHLLRAFNAREGLGKEADVLPKKLFEPLTGKGPTAGVALTHEEFERARDLLPPGGVRSGHRLPHPRQARRSRAGLAGGRDPGLTASPSLTAREMT